MDVEPNTQLIIEKVFEALAKPKTKVENIYGDGDAGKKIANILEKIGLDKIIQKKLREHNR